MTKLHRMYNTNANYGFELTMDQQGPINHNKLYKILNKGEARGCWRAYYNSVLSDQLFCKPKMAKIVPKPPVC